MGIVMETIDIVRQIVSDTDDIVVQLADIKNAVNKLHCGMLSLPGTKKANERQAKAISNAMEALSDWRHNHLEEMRKAFE